MSFMSTDTKGDIMRNYGSIASKYYGYNISVIDLRNPMRSHGNNLLHLVNKYMDLYAVHPDTLAYKAKAEKYAKIISKTIILSGILNAVVQFARKYKSEQIDTIFCFDKVEPDDGGLADYYKAMTDHDAFAALNDDPAEDDFDDSEEYDDKLDEYDRDEEEPAVERDFEG